MGLNPATSTGFSCSKVCSAIGRSAVVGWLPVAFDGLAADAAASIWFVAWPQYGALSIILYVSPGVGGRDSCGAAYFLHPEASSNLQLLLHSLCSCAPNG